MLRVIVGIHGMKQQIGIAGAVRTGRIKPTNHTQFDPKKQNEWAWALQESGDVSDIPVRQNGMFVVEAPPLRPVLNFCLPTTSSPLEEAV